MSDVRSLLEMTAEPIVTAWTISHELNTNGAELQRAIVKSFAGTGDPVCWSRPGGFTFEKTFTFKEHGEFFRGILAMASLRYAGDFYELLKRYGTIKVTITKTPEEKADA